MTEFSDFFAHLTGNSPFPYQCRMATGPWPQVVDVPTGLGKTAAVGITWLWKRLQADPDTGRRLVYCLPMRTLVEQTCDAARSWCEAAEVAFTEAGLVVPTVHVLMGGDVDTKWDTDPVRPQILVGTQDMLLSRALNRGYAASRFRWPVQFGLLSNDVVWVFDETQLMGVGVETSAQLQAFRDRFHSIGSACSVWMSATLGTAQLDTVDHPEPEQGWRAEQLTAADRDIDAVQRRVGARKRLRATGLRLSKDTAKDHAKDVAAFVIEQHAQVAELTLVVVNRVQRAQAIYQAMLELGADADTLALVHSRFRGPDRRRHEQLLHASGDRIVIATQAVEAGVDVSARSLITELAPWPSLVQRFGRCNRYGMDDAACVAWMDIDTGDPKRDDALPYETTELDRARALLETLGDGADVGPAALGEVAYTPPPIIRPVLRQRDVLELFDTTADLCGNDIDVSRYVRDGQDTDVQVYWRIWDEDDRVAPERDEICRVSIGACNDFLTQLSKRRRRLGTSDKDREKSRAFRVRRWDSLLSAWVAVDKAFPGQVLRIDPVAGGYDAALGWTGNVAPKSLVPIAKGAHDGETSARVEALRDDPDSMPMLRFQRGRARWVLLTPHLGHVEKEVGTLAESLASEWTDSLAIAGRWHDVGKAHPAFQRKLVQPVVDDPDHAPPGSGLWAKSSHARRWKENPRPEFRHELVSALLWLEHGPAADASQRDLVAYLVAAHHGKVRLSIRALPTEARPDEPNRLFARGVWDGDEIPKVELPDGSSIGPVAVSLEPMRLGQGSWAERMLRLRDQLGPFRLGFLETLVRVADWDASSKEQNDGYND